MKIKACQQPGHLKAEVEGRTIYGYASVFGNVDSYNERVIKGAFKKTIKERGPQGSGQIKFLWNHIPQEIPPGVLKMLREDEVGLAYEATALKTYRGDELLEAVKEGAVNRNSFGYDVIMATESEDIKGVVDLTELKLYEISPVNWPANESAAIMGVKGIEEQIASYLKQFDPRSVADAAVKEMLERKAEKAIEKALSTLHDEDAIITYILESLLKNSQLSGDNLKILEAALAEAKAEESRIVISISVTGSEVRVEEEETTEEEDNTEKSETEEDKEEKTEEVEESLDFAELISAVSEVLTSDELDDTILDKAGRTLSTATREQLASLQEQLTGALTGLQALLESNDPSTPVNDGPTDTTEPPVEEIDPGVVQSLSEEIEDLFNLD